MPWFSSFSYGREVGSEDEIEHAKASTAQQHTCALLSLAFKKTNKYCKISHETVRVRMCFRNVVYLDSALSRDNVVAYISIQFLIIFTYWIILKFPFA